MKGTPDLEIWIIRKPGGPGTFAGRFTDAVAEDIRQMPGYKKMKLEQIKYNVAALSAATLASYAAHAARRERIEVRAVGTNVVVFSRQVYWK